MFSENLKRYRKKRGLSQKDFAKMVGTSQSAICLYEVGTRTPNMKTIFKMASALGVPAEELIK